KIDGAHGDAQRARHALQRVVSSEMSESVVVELEAIEIEHEDPELLRIADGPLDLRLDALAEGAEVRQIGQVVGPRMGAKLVGHVIEGRAELGDLTVAADRGMRVEIAVRDSIGRA